MVFSLPILEYKINALEPYISEGTVNNHYNGHHANYVKNLNGLVANNDLSNKSLKEIVLSTNNAAQQKIFNNAAQTWNHNFYWQSIKPGGGREPKVQIHDAILHNFGSYEQFCQKFKDIAVGHFASGWVWLVIDRSRKLELISTANADTPILHDNLTPLLTCDVWEHAYYLDYQYKRLEYINMFLNNLINWDFAENNMILWLSSTNRH